MDRFMPGEDSPTLQACQELGLTERQAQVLARIAEGKPNKIICRELNLAVGTVKIHVSAILRALKVSNRTQAAITARALERSLPDVRPAMNSGHRHDPRCKATERL